MCIRDSPKTVTENKEAKTENTAKPADPDDIYATLDWDTNPPINGFYDIYYLEGSEMQYH